MRSAWEYCGEDGAGVCGWGHSGQVCPLSGHVGSVVERLGCEWAAAGEVGALEGQGQSSGVNRGLSVSKARSPSPEGFFSLVNKLH